MALQSCGVFTYSHEQEQSSDEAAVRGEKVERDDPLLTCDASTLDSQWRIVFFLWVEQLLGAKSVELKRMEWFRSADDVARCGIIR
jgi:hypothetical protein